MIFRRESELHCRLPPSLVQRVVEEHARQSQLPNHLHGRTMAAGLPEIKPSVILRRILWHVHATLCRSRRNWKNSTPSRSRRFIICGLRTISPTIEAIFGARK